MKLRMILAFIILSLFAPLYSMEAPESSQSSGFEVYGTYWCQGTPIKIGRGPVEKQKFPNDAPSAIVCFTNSHLTRIAGTMNGVLYNDASIRQELSEITEKQCPILDQSVRCPVGDAVCTSAGNLQGVTNIIHTVVPNCVSPEQNRRRKELLSNTYKNCLLRVQEHNVSRVAFASIGEGYQPAKKIPVDEAATVAVKTIAQFVQENPSTVQEIRLVFRTISRDDDDDYAAYLKVLGQISDGQKHKVTSEATIDPKKLENLDVPLLTLIKRNCLRNWAKYRNEIILGSCGTVTALCAGWLLWHRK